MIDSEQVIKAINAKLDSMSHDEAISYLRSMGFKFVEDNCVAMQNELTDNLHSTFENSIDKK